MGRIRGCAWWRTGVRERRRRGWGEPAKGRGARSGRNLLLDVGLGQFEKIGKKILGRTPGHGPGGPGSKSAPCPCPRSPPGHVAAGQPPSLVAAAAAFALLDEQRERQIQAVAMVLAAIRAEEHRLAPGRLLRRHRDKPTPTMTSNKLSHPSTTASPSGVAAPSATCRSGAPLPPSTSLPRPRGAVEAGGRRAAPRGVLPPRGHRPPPGPSMRWVVLAVAGC